MSMYMQRILCLRIYRRMYTHAAYVYTYMEYVYVGDVYYAAHVYGYAYRYVLRMYIRTYVLSMYRRRVLCCASHSHWSASKPGGRGGVEKRCSSPRTCHEPQKQTLFFWTQRQKQTKRCACCASHSRRSSSEVRERERESERMCVPARVRGAMTFRNMRTKLIAKCA